MNHNSVEFFSEGSKVRGNFFSSSEKKPTSTLLLVPGWPGNPNDVLGLGEQLSQLNHNVLMFNPRGFHFSEGVHKFSNTLQDINAAIEWLKKPNVITKHQINIKDLAIGGYSFGGAMTMAYAAKVPGVKRLISIAGNDLGEFARKMRQNPEFAETTHQDLLSTLAPNGPVRFNFDEGNKELFDNQHIYGLRENAENLADRSILIIGGWEDMQVTIEQIHLPLYRSLKAAGAKNVIFNTYHTDHEFGNMRNLLAEDISKWLIESKIYLPQNNITPK